MLDALYLSLDQALGLSIDEKELGVGHMSLRAVVVFIAAAAMIRIGNKRFMGKSTAMDVMLGIMFGSIVGRAVTGNAAFFPTLAAGFTLIFLHWVFSAIAFRSHAFGKLVKGHHQELVKDGEIDWNMMRRSHVTEHDLHEALRSHGKSPEVSRIKSAHLERNGDISLLMQ